jgi:ABC-type nickel/cobalt efflux system permease component RcnA
MFVVAVLGLIFNLIQMKILHSGDGHYHLGGDSHSHDHDHGHDHSHSHGHGHSHDHSHKPKKISVDNEKNLKEGLISKDDTNHS